MTDLQQNCAKLLKKRGIKTLDQLHLDLIYGGRQSKILNRSLYYIKPEGLFFEEISGEVHSLIEIPTLKNETFLISIRFCEKMQCYIIKSHKNLAFELNGNMVFEAFLQHGDKVKIGYNLLMFKKSQNDSEQPLSILNTNAEVSEKIIKSNATILLEGETGTGKTSLAKKIHQESCRTGKFVHVNISSFSPSLLESELFGHIRGAFTGAVTERKGAFLEAHRGTLFLDEIDSLSSELQVKLLTFMDDFLVKAVGSNVEFKVDTRLIIASGKPLKNLVDAGLMRNDFYFRAKSGVTLKLISLRDDPQLVELFCRQFEIQNEITIDRQLLNYYKVYSWPGNFRQLQSHLSRKVLMAESRYLKLCEIDNELDSDMVEAGYVRWDFKKRFSSLKDVKQSYARRVYFEMGENVELASSILGINYKTLKNLVLVN